MRRRLASSKVNNERNSSPVEQAAPGAYEMLGGVNSQPNYANAAVPPANTYTPQPIAPPVRSSLHDTTLVDNDLYK